MPWSRLVSGNNMALGLSISGQLQLNVIRRWENSISGSWYEYKETHPTIFEFRSDTVPNWTSSGSPDWYSIETTLSRQGFIEVKKNMTQHPNVMHSPASFGGSVGNPHGLSVALGTVSGQEFHTHFMRIFQKACDVMKISDFRAAVDNCQCLEYFLGDAIHFIFQWKRTPGVMDIVTEESRSGFARGHSLILKMGVKDLLNEGVAYLQADIHDCMQDIMQKQGYTHQQILAASTHSAATPSVSVKIPTGPHFSKATPCMSKYPPVKHARYENSRIATWWEFMEDGNGTFFAANDSNIKLDSATNFGIWQKIQMNSYGLVSSAMWNSIEDVMQKTAYDTVVDLVPGTLPTGQSQNPPGGTYHYKVMMANSPATAGTVALNIKEAEITLDVAAEIQEVRDQIQVYNCISDHGLRYWGKSYKGYTQQVEIVGDGIMGYTVAIWANDGAKNYIPQGTCMLIPDSHHLGMRLTRSPMTGRQETDCVFKQVYKTKSKDSAERWVMDQLKQLKLAVCSDKGINILYNQSQASPQYKDAATQWKAEGRCPLCGELGAFVQFAMVCSNHGPYS